jgi:hypothetical protein
MKRSAALKATTLPTIVDPARNSSELTPPVKVIALARVVPGTLYVRLPSRPPLMEPALTMETLAPLMAAPPLDVAP